MKYKPGDKVRIKSLDWYNANKDEDGRVYCSYIGFCKEMTKYCGKVLTIMTIANQDIGSKQKYFMHETDYAWGFTDDMIEGLADETTENDVESEMVNKEEFISKACSLLYAMLTTQDINDYYYVTAPAYDDVADFVDDFCKSIEK